MVLQKTMTDTEPLREPGNPNKRELEVLQCIAVLTMELGEPPHLSAVAAAVGCGSRQAAYYWARRLRRKQLLEDGTGSGKGAEKQGLVLSHNGKLAVATASP